MKTRSLFKMLMVAVIVMAATTTKAADKEEVKAAEKSETATAGKTVLSEAAFMMKKTEMGGDLAIFYLSDVVTVSCINKGQQTAVFSVSDANGDVIYRKTTRNNALVHHRVATEQLPDGKYFASLKVGNEKYTNEFEIAR